MATFSVMTSGFAPAALDAHPAHASVQRLPRPEDPEFLTEALTHIDAGPPEAPVLVLHAAGREATRKVHVLRALSRARRVVPLGLSLPPTALAARATWVASLAERRVPIGIAIGHLQRHADIMPTVAVVGSVAKVDLPEVRFRHHLLSWLPGVRLAVVMGGGSTEVRSARRFVPDLAADGMDLVVSGERAVVGTLELPNPTDGQVADLTGTVDATAWWGRGRYFEQTLVPRDIVDALRVVSREKFGRCPVCGGVAVGTCPLCAVREERVA